ncbi:hypothetical protein RO3G_06162 [Rhizopus delemar RA 99-880]|uniref:Uncharacterized protein n=1 Tax=Rhizopus delemar (strain RA 99-880 / ATCC MYA-4621 / FGSC 9543 / NRRL 43880) TaxID=246409 RepID=I1BZ27_RHIO9|nr:hypothetical protein RO3G_06162 [Rhizopus delemar RA 99-880]|eukprot:EIE81457.1 hypothetical protein RO3G_06162 [Rhizopus delemar RA 99-880]
MASKILINAICCSSYKCFGSSISFSIIIDNIGKYESFTKLDKINNAKNILLSLPVS